MLRHLKFGAIMAAVTLFVLAFNSMAHAYESRLLSTHGYWDVYVEIYDDGAMACSMQSTNEEGQEIDMTVFQNRDIALYFKLPGMATNQAEFTSDIILSIDRQRTTLTDAIFDSLSNGNLYVSFAFMHSDAVRIFDQMERGNILYLYRPNGTQASSWSLRGSYAASAATYDCVSKLQPTW